MIELTEEQVNELVNGGSTPPLVTNPQTKEVFVLVRAEDYERLTSTDYDDSPWTEDELHAAAWEMMKRPEWAAFDDGDVTKRP